jgi:hypothetical protein
MRNPAFNPNIRSVFIQTYRVWFVAGVMLVAWSIASRFSLIDLHFGLARATVEHGVGGFGVMLILFGIFCASDFLPVGKIRDGTHYCREMARRTAAILVVIHFIWESGQAYCPIIAAIYGLLPRGYIQWEQVLADWLGILVGIACIGLFIRSQANRLREVLPVV